MTHRSKRWKNFFCAFAGLILFLFLACFDAVDHRPYFRQPYYKRTLEALRRHSLTNVLSHGKLEAGFGRVRLTPGLNAAVENPAQGQFKAVPLAGYGNREGKPASGVHDDLWVKAVALRIGDQMQIIYGVDALIIPREVADMAARRLEKGLGLRREQLYFSATHTHCSLGGWGEGYVGEAFAGGYDPGVRVWFAECLVNAGTEAVRDLKPAGFGNDRFDAPQFVRNRLVGDAGRVDSGFNYAVIKQEGGGTAILGSYAAHATVLSGSVMEFSADYPGYWQRAIERETGGIAVFLAGAVGSHGPVAGESGFTGAERMGEALAKEVLAKVPRIPLTNSVTAGSLGLDIALPELNTRVLDGIRLRPWVSSRLLPPLQPSFLQVYRLGETLWISTPCDFSGELAIDIRNLLQRDGLQAIITSFNGDYVGYVIPEKYYHLNGYEPRLMSFYGPCVPDYMDELIRRMSREMLRKN